MGIADRKEREKQEMREKIIQTASTMFVDLGFEKTTVRKIADKIEYSPATIYLYFKNKDELFYAIHEAGFNRLYDLMQAAQEPQGTLARVKELGNIYLKFAFENPAYYDLMFIVRAPMNTEMTQEKWQAGLRSFSCLYETVVSCVENKVFKTQDVENITFLLWSCMHGMASLAIRDRLKMFPDQSHEKLIYPSINMFNEMLSGL